MLRSTVVIAAALALGSIPAAAQEETVKVTGLTDQLYLLTTDQGNYTTNTVAFVGDDGILLIDTQSEADAEELKKVVDAFGKGPPKFIINTHRHVEHVGGNATFGEAPIVIAHDLVPGKLRSGGYIFDEFPDATYPDLTFNDSLTLYFNGERIRLIALPGGHDDNEIIIHFTESKVVHLSSLVNGFTFPSVDSDGDVLKFEQVIAQAIQLLPEDVIIISGHNSPGTWNDLHSYRKMLLETTEVVRSGLAEGRDLATLQEEGALDAWESYAASYVSVDEWTDYLVEALEATGERKRTVYEPLYEVWKDRGATAAVERYRLLKSEQSDEYDFNDVTLVVIGSKLLNNDHVEAAITFLEASIQEYPDGKYGYYADYQLANAFNKLGDKDAAVDYCEKALELNPEFEAAASLLEQLTNE